jgi:peptidoglycan/LPS O-acetylase OafA/YrhL
MKVVDFSSKPVVLNSEPREGNSVKRAIHPRGWMPPLDGIRGLAILMVMLFHFNVLLNPQSIPENFVRSLSRFGWTGVDLFFVLSGFLITGILLDSRNAENYFRSFYLRRITRIFPLYYLSLAVVFWVVPTVLLNGPRPSSYQRVAYLVYAQNWHALSGNPYTLSLLDPYWSLGVEEQFYLVWPLVVFLFPPQRVLKIAIGGALFSLALRLVLLAAHAIPATIYTNTLTRADSLLIGAACVFLLRNEVVNQRLRRLAVWLWLTPIVSLPLLRLASPSFSNNAPLIQSIGYSAIALSYAGLLVSLVARMQESSLLLRFFTSRAMTTLGKYSYGAYIWHILVLTVVVRSELAILHALPPAFLNIPLVVAATLAVSMCSYALIERPFLSLKRYFEPRLQELKDGPPPSESRAGVVA